MPFSGVEGMSAGVVTASLHVATEGDPLARVCQCHLGDRQIDLHHVLSYNILRVHHQNERAVTRSVRHIESWILNSMTLQREPPMTQCDAQARRNVGRDGGTCLNQWPTPLWYAYHDATQQVKKVVCRRQVCLGGSRSLILIPRRRVVVDVREVGVRVSQFGPCAY